MNKILIGLCQLRNSFLESAANQSSMIEALTGNSVNAVVGAISDGVGKSISVVQDGENFVFSVLDKSKSSLTDYVPIMTGPWSDIQTQLDDIISDQTMITFSVPGGSESFDFRGFLQSSVDGYKVNSALGGIIDKFTTQQKVNTQDLISQLESYDLNSSYKNQIKSIIASASDEDGTISSINFLQIMKYMSEEGKSAVEDGSISLDTTETRYLDNFLSTMVPGIISTVASLLSALLTIISRILGVIVAAIGWITSSIFNAVIGAVPSEVEIIDPLSSTDWFEGPSTAREDELGIPNLQDGDIIGSDFVRVIPEGCFDACLFMNPTKDGLMWNRFIALNLDRDKIWNRLANILNISIDRRSGTLSHVAITFKTSVNWDYLVIPDDCYLDDAARENVLGYSQREISNYIISCFGAYCGFCVMQYMLVNNLNSLNLDLYFDTAGYSTGWRNFMTADIAYTVANHNIPLNRLLNFLNVWWYVNGSGWYHDFDNDTLTTINLQENDLTNNSVMLYASTTVPSGEYGVVNGRFYLSNRLSYCPNNYLTHYIRVNGDGLFYIDNSTLENSSMQLSCIPKPRMFRFAGYSQTKLIVVTTIASITVAALLVAGSIACKAMKKRRWKKMMQRKSELQKVKDNYDHGRASLDDLYKAQKSYNFKAKLFGWDTYDAANDWWDSPETSSSPDNTSIQQICKLISG